MDVGDGVELALLDWGGAGPVVLCHHANGFCGALWEPVARALRGEARFVAVDARGHGRSSRPEDPAAYAWRHFVDDIGAVAEALAAEAPDGRVVGLGHSFGGTSLLGAASQRPDCFRALVLCDPVVIPRETGRPANERGRELAERTRKRRRTWVSRSEAMAYWETRPLFADWTREAMALYALDGLRERADGGVELACPPEVESAVFANGRDHDVFAGVESVAAPVLFLRATRGNFPPELYRRLAERIPRARVEDVEAGHLLLMEDPARVESALRRFALA